MRWQLTKTLEWAEPLTFAERLPGQDMALLYSGMQQVHSGQYSFLFAHPIDRKTGEGWDDFPLTIPSTDGLPQWVGFLGYGLREPHRYGAPASIVLPPLQFVRYARLWRFDHHAQQIAFFTAEGVALPPLPVAPAHAEARREAPQLHDIDSNFTRASYEQTVADTVARIHRGDFYQANITRKFYGRFATPPDSWSLFCRLVQASPAPFSAYIRDGGRAILSSSPECFLSIAPDGAVTTRPIKGSARRSADPAQDAAIRADLVASEKNAAENLMIVDLMRNDLARMCEPGSIAVSEQSGLYSYATIHHLISTVHGKKRADASVREVLRACFPPGSMTGAPKIAAMAWCEQVERMERGVYSGALGWLGHDCADFSVVIRTLLIEDTKFEFQVGGGIVADSDPADEWRETLTKARGILAALGRDESAIAAL